MPGQDKNSLKEVPPSGFDRRFSPSLVGRDARIAPSSTCENHSVETAPEALKFFETGSTSSYRIESITLDRMLPHVFANEATAESEVWQTPLTFRRGESYLVEATSGAGKSSMCAYIFGARTDFRGSLLFNATDTRSFDMHRWQEIRRLNLAYLPQEPGLFPELTLIENIRLKNSLTGHASDRQIADWIEELGLSSRIDRPAGRLSVGQQQRAALIRSLCQPFDFILLDEPVSHLDEANNRIAARIIAREAARQGAGVISTSVGNHLLLDYSHTLKL